MKLELKDGNWDIYLIFLITLIFTLIAIIFPFLELTIIIIGIIVLSLFPGYVLIALLFPEKYENEEESENQPG